MSCGAGLGAGLGAGCGGAGCGGAGLAATNSFRFMLHPTTKNGRRLPLTLGGECRGDRTWWAPWRVHTGRPVRVRCRVRFLLALVPFPAAVAVDPAAPLWAWCRPMFRLAPVLLMMAAVASGAAADPACLPDCNVENLIGGHDLRFANMAGASLRGAALTLANAARADLSGADLSFATGARRIIGRHHAHNGAAGSTAAAAPPRRSGAGFQRFRHHAERRPRECSRSTGARSGPPSRARPRRWRRSRIRQQRRQWRSGLAGPSPGPPSIATHAPLDGVQPAAVRPGS